MRNPRCPYCIDFRKMDARADGTYICRNCGHKVSPDLSRPRLRQVCEMATCRLNRSNETKLNSPRGFDMVSVTVPLTCAVQAAQPSDANAMAALAVQLGYPCTGTDVRRRLDDMKDPTQHAVFVAVLPEGDVVGWVCVYIFRAVELDTFAEISSLVVDDALRSRGIGKALLHAGEDWARRAGRAAISVNSNIIRDRAHRFYESNGYELVKTQKMFRKSL